MRGHKPNNTNRDTANEDTNTNRAEEIREVTVKGEREGEDVRSFCTFSFWHSQEKGNKLVK